MKKIIKAPKNGWNSMLLLIVIWAMLLQEFIDIPSYISISISFLLLIWVLYDFYKFFKWWRTIKKDK